MAFDYYFRRDNKGVEIDCLQSGNNILKAIEIKSGAIVHQDFFKNVLYYQKLSNISNEQLILVYGGNESYIRSVARIISWKDIDQIG
ncbi:MAG: DUF4143 domain-containing protein [Bacteroidales bacterium]|nr:DUF4143 domain-containing protein [Bacteroidales bacterium]